MSIKGIYHQIRDTKVEVWGSDKDKIIKAMDELINSIKNYGSKRNRT